MYKIFIYLLLAASVALGGCIKDDIPYPRIQANFTSIAAAGATGADIDSANRVLTLNFGEEADIYNVDITDYTLTPGAEIVGDGIRGGIDLSEPRSVTLRLYQDYEWTLQASRPVDRYLTVDGQVGETQIDVPGRRVIVTVSDRVDVSKLKVLSMKLGPVGSTATPDLSGQTVNLSLPVQVKVDDHGHTSIWTIVVIVRETVVTTSAVDAWSCVAWLYGEAEGSRDNGFEYRQAGSDQWIRVPKSTVKVEGGSFSTCVPHLLPNTAYQARAYSNADFGDVIDFTTQGVGQLPNSNFDQWWQDGAVWNPWAEGGTPFWDTGNKGAATLGQSNSVPTDDTPTGRGRAAKLETRFIGVGSLGKLGAGNIFIGQYLRTEGTNGVLSFGREFALRPTKVRGWYKYKCMPINYATGDYNRLKGQPDTCSVWLALIDTPNPLEIRTNPKNPSLFDSEASYVIAYGKIEAGRSIDEWTQFEFTLNYRSTKRVPRYVLMVASASKFGDFFTGGAGSTLYVDDFELLYDY